MKKLLITLQFVFITAVVNLFAGSYSGGAGTSGSPYQIASAADLIALSNTSADWDKSFIQTADIVFNSDPALEDWDGNGSVGPAEGFLPIGNDSDYFTGSYDGQTHTITNLYINRGSMDYIGLFGVISTGSIVKNLGLINVNITGRGCVGGLVGWGSDGTTGRCFSSGSVSGTEQVGGLIGLCSCIISFCYSTASVTASDIMVGGLVGQNDSGTIRYCYSTGSVSGDFVAGGLVGFNYNGTILRCYSTGSVNGTNSGEIVGGLVGWNDIGTVSYCYSTGSVVGWQSVGGLVGRSGTGTIENCFWNTETSGQSSLLTGATGKTTALMKTQSTFSDAGWSFSAGILNWVMSSNITFGGYPTLQWTDAYAVAPSSNQIASLPNLVWVTENNARWAAAYMQTANLNMWTTPSWDGNRGWTPIGNLSNCFGGSYDGQGHTISNLFINRSSTDYIGLFGILGGFPTFVKDLGLRNEKLTGHENVGGLVGFTYAPISKCYSTGNISGYSHVGGLVGVCDSEVSQSYSTCSLIGNSCIGGLLGSIYIGTLRDCYSTGSVYGGFAVGGLVGNWFNGTLSECYSTGTVNAGDRVGGLIGMFGAGFSTNCFWDVETSDQASSLCAEGKTTAQMKNISTFTGWNFTAGTGVWKIESGPFISYPYLMEMSYDTPGASPAVNPIPGLQKINLAPTDIALTATSINENVAANSTIGTLSSTDLNAGDTFTYTLVTGTGDIDNPSFNISGSNLRITGSPNAETKNSYSVRLRSADQDGLFFEKVIAITVNDLKDIAPIITAGQEFHVTEQSPNGTAVGTAVATDGDLTPTTFQNWTITAGNSSGYFTINSSTGMITVVDNTGLNPYINLDFILTLTVSDGTNTSISQTIKIIIDAINDDSPVVTASQSFAIDENSANGTTVGTVLATDPDYGTVLRQWTITGGNTGNGFGINATTGVLTVNNSAALDRETNSSFTLTIRVSDGIHTASGQVVVNLNNVNETPTDISLSASSVNENVPANTTVGTLSSTDPDATNTFTYTLVTGAGSTDNALFNINGSSLRITNSPDYETKNSYSVRIRTTDQGNLIYEKAFTITINDVNDAPTIVLQNVTSGMAENTSTHARIKVADIVVTDDALGTNILSLTGTDASSFEVVASALYLKAGISLNYEVKPVYSVTVNVSDNSLVGSTPATVDYTLTLTDLNESPTDLALSVSSINENVFANSVVGSLSSVDPDAGNPFDYTLVSGVGGTDNASFNISGGSLRISISPDYDVKNSYSVRLRTTDQGGLYFEKAFTVTINDLNDAPLVTTQAVTAITSTSAMGHGNITDLGIPNPTSYGVCWNTTGTPTVSGSKTDMGAATVTGTFDASMPGLMAGTTYYVRAFATNTAGTGYGAQVSFGTPQITAVGTMEPFASCADLASSAQRFSVSGVNLTTNLAIEVPAGFEVSLNAGYGYTRTITLPVNGGMVPVTQVYVRMSGNATGTPAGRITLTSSGITSQDLTLSGVVYPAPAEPLFTADDNKRVYNGTLQIATVVVEEGESVDWYAGSTGAAPASAPSGIKPGSYTAWARARNADGCYSASRTAVTLTVSRAALVVSATGENRDFDCTANAVVTLSDNRIKGDQLMLQYATALFADQNSGENKPITVSGITLSGADAGNYTFNTTATAHGSIRAAAIPVITGASAVCAGSAGSLYSVSAVTGHSWQWSVSGGTITAGAGTPSVTVTWGAGPSGTVNLTEVIDAKGCSVTANAKTVAIHAVPAPIISGLTSVCAGSTGTTYSTDNVQGNSCTWSVTGGTITSGTGTSSIKVTWGTTGTGTVNLVQKNTLSGCSAAAPAKSVTIHPLPVPVITGSAIVCGDTGGSSFSTTGMSGHSYSWSVTGGTITGGEGTSAITVLWASQGTGTVNVTETVSATGCSAAAPQKTAVIAPLLKPVITGTSEICAGSSGQLNASIYGGSWSSGAPAVASVSSSGLLSGLSGGTAVITYMIRNFSGCESRATRTVTVHALPQIAAITGAASVCAGSSLTLANATPAGEWSSDSPGVATIGAASGLVTAGSPGSAGISYTVRNVAGCVSKAIQNITVHAVPAILSVTPAERCQAGSLTLGATATEGSVSWFAAATGGQSLGSGTSFNTPVISATTLYYAEALANGCSSVTRTAVFATIKPAPQTPSIGEIVLPTCTMSTGMVYLGNLPSAGIWKITQNPGGIITTGVGSTAIVTGLQSGSYTFAVTSATGCSSPVSATVVIGDQPMAPSAVKAREASGILAGSFMANWNASLSATAYRLDIATDNGFATLVPGWADKNVGNLTSFGVMGLAAKTTYYYRVRAVNDCGSSPSSDVIKVTTAMEVPPVVTVLPVSGVGITGLTISWGALPTAGGYYLEVSTDPAFGSFVPGYDGRDVGNVTTFSLTGLAAGTTYYYRIRAYNEGGSGAGSVAGSVTTLPALPAVPVALQATAIQQTGFTAQWKSSLSASGYRVDVATDAGFANLVSGYSNRDAGNGLSVNLSGLSARTTYYYRVRGYNVNGTSNSSNTILVKTLSVPPAAPAGLTIVSSCNDLVTMSWSKGTDPFLSRYRIFAGTGSNPVTQIDSTDAGTISKTLTGLIHSQNYFFRITAVNDDGTESPYSTQVNTQIKTGLVPTVSVKWKSLLICSNVKDSISKYQWYLSNAPIPGATGQYYAVGKVSGSYKVVTTDLAGCVNSSNTLALTVPVSLTAYPNPAAINFSLNLKNASEGDAVISMYNAAGQKIMEVRTENVSQELIREIAVDNLQDGAYVIQVTVNGQESYYTKMLVKKN